MRVLFLYRWFPYPADNGSRIRIYNLLKALGSRWQVDLISFAECPVTAPNLLNCEVSVARLRCCLIGLIVRMAGERDQVFSRRARAQSRIQTIPRCASAWPRAQIARVMMG
jgi:hypothetical protein